MHLSVLPLSNLIPLNNPEHTNILGKVTYQQDDRDKPEWSVFSFLLQYVYLSWNREHTFHGLHKDLLLLTGVLFIQQHAVEDAAKSACQRQNTGF